MLFHQIFKQATTCFKHLGIAHNQTHSKKLPTLQNKKLCSSHRANKLLTNLTQEFKIIKTFTLYILA
jgi:hypothetical protein